MKVILPIKPTLGCEKSILDLIASSRRTPAAVDSGYAAS
jgi:hypothetical protein